MVDYDRRTVQELLKTNKKLALLNNEEKLLKEYANIVYGGKGVLTISVQILERHKILATNIMKLLSKEYTIEL